LVAGCDAGSAAAAAAAEMLYGVARNPQAMITNAIERLDLIRAPRCEFRCASDIREASDYFITRLN
jgi:hypothetical protein